MIIGFLLVYACGFLLFYACAVLTLMYRHAIKPPDPKDWAELLKAQQDGARLIQKEAYDRFLEEEQNRKLKIKEEKIAARNPENDSIN